MTVNHIVKASGYFLSKLVLENYFGVLIKDMDYMSLIDAIPKEWKNTQRDSLNQMTNYK